MPVQGLTAPPLSSSSGRSKIGPGEARGSAKLSRTRAADIVAEKIAFGAAASPGLRFAPPEDDERGNVFAGG